MGVPSFFAWLTKKYPQIISRDNINKCDALFLDWNCGIHPACRRVMERYKDSSVPKQQLEDEMMREVCTYMDEIVQYAKPQMCLYIAIDGIAPRAKMNQQRSRRFKSIKEKQEVNEIKKKYGEPCDNQWDTNAITPGTEFMEKLTDKLLNHVKEHVLYEALQVIISDSSVPMEGEHKLLKNIRTQGHKFSELYVYGLDADLIFLTTLSKKQNIFLMREKDQLNVKTESPFCFVNIDCFKKCLHSEIGTPSDCIEKTASDFAFMCFFLGNDFLPKIPSIFIRERGIDMLMESYKRVKNEQKILIDDTNKINFKTLRDILTPLAKEEGLQFINFYKKYGKPRETNPASNFMEEIQQLEFVDPCPPDDPVKLGKSGWKERYYSHYFGTNDIQKIENVCQNYADGLLWNWAYYTRGVVSWSWYYPFHHAPILSDLVHYLCHVRIPKFTVGQPVVPFVQLLSVLPRQSFHLLTPEIRSKIESQSELLNNTYPVHFEEDSLQKTKRWQTIPILPFVNIHEIEKIAANNNDKRNRNSSHAYMIQKRKK